MFDPDALVRRTARTADNGRALAVQPPVRVDHPQASKRLADANGLDGHRQWVRLMSGQCPVIILSRTKRAVLHFRYRWRYSLVCH